MNVKLDEEREQSIFKKAPSTEVAMSAKSRGPGKTRILKCWNCNKIGHKTQHCRAPKKSESNEVSFAASAMLNEDMPHDENWYSDSGATRHMTYQKENLMNYEEFKIPRKVIYGNGEDAFASKPIRQGTDTQKIRNGGIQTDSYPHGSRSRSTAFRNSTG
jgi:hypothetical protein